jgi:hypothetical protein
VSAVEKDISIWSRKKSSAIQPCLVSCKYNNTVFEDKHKLYYIKRDNGFSLPAVKLYLFIDLIYIGYVLCVQNYIK